MARVLLEVCIATLDDALAAEAGGADRLEVNAALELGGLTPSPGLFERIREQVALPLAVMLRPRPGGFHYSTAEFSTLLRDAEWLLNCGADAIVFGVLTADGEVDVERCRVVADLARQATAVFHRAFDLTPEPRRALDQLIELGFGHVMTSGQQATTPAGAPLIRELISHAAGRIEILPAGGITVANVADVVTRTGCNQIHASLRADREDASARHRPYIRFGSASGREDVYRGTDAGMVRAMRDALDALHDPAG